MKNKTLKLSLPFYLLVFSWFLISCNPQPTSSPIETLPGTQTSLFPSVTLTPSPEPPPPHVLSICLGQEPESLFLYGDASVAAVNVRQAIYDGPIDILDYEVQPVILENRPNLANGFAVIEPVQVEPGKLIVDSDHRLTDLDEETTYFPSGCTDPDCIQSFTGGDSVTMDQLIVRFKLRSDIQWSDGEPLTATDSVYSYEVARDLYPRVRPELIRHTSSYQAVDETTVEWRAVPGYLDALYFTNFFTPLPQHLWGNLSPQELLTANISTQSPIGWGPYVIDEWIIGDHISLNVNPNYFRAEEGLPQFDHLVYRFISSNDEALSALLAGECDLADEIALSEVPTAELFQLQEESGLKVVYEKGGAWEHIDFGIMPFDPAQLSLFQSKELRQAIAMCIDRQGIADQLFLEQTLVPHTYVPPTHPLYASEVRKYAFNPQTSIDLLESLGWIDADNEPSTARVALGVPGVPDGIPLAFTYQTLSGGERQQAAQMVQTYLAQCGIQMDLSFSDWDTLFAPGPEGPIFGRQFEITQFAWSTSLEPPCFLYMSDEIPGSYPEFPKGWGGANAIGYTNAEFDQACMNARFSLPDMLEHESAHHQAQAFFAEDLPAIPLYLHLDSVVTRPDLCGVILDPSAASSLWNLETLDYGSHCEP